RADKTSAGLPEEFSASAAAGGEDWEWRRRHEYSPFLLIHKHEFIGIQNDQAKRGQSRWPVFFRFLLDCGVGFDHSLLLSQKIQRSSDLFRSRWATEGELKRSFDLSDRVIPRFAN